MDGLSESARFKSGVLGISTVALASKPSSTDFVDGGEVRGGGAHSNSRYGFRHLGIATQSIPA